MALRIAVTQQKNFSRTEIRGNEAELERAFAEVQIEGYYWDKMEEVIHTAGGITEAEHLAQKLRDARLEVEIDSSVPGNILLEKSNTIGPTAKKDIKQIAADLVALNQGIADEKLREETVARLRRNGVEVALR